MGQCVVSVFPALLWSRFEQYCSSPDNETMARLNIEMMEVGQKVGQKGSHWARLHHLDSGFYCVEPS